MDVIDLNFKKMADAHLCEIYQAVKLQYAFLSADNEQVNVFALCKDFLHDITRAFLRGEDMAIYSMVYRYGTNPPVDMSKTRIMARYDNGVNGTIEDKDDQMDHAIKLINYYEDILKVPHSKVERLSDSPWKEKTIWLFTGDKIWMTSPFLISLYTMLMRLGEKKMEFTDGNSLNAAIEAVCNKQNKVAHDNDVGYLKSIKTKLEFALTNLDKLKQGEEVDPAYYNKDISLHSFHNDCGIVALLAGNYMHYWTREKLAELWEKRDKEPEAKKEEVKVEEKPVEKPVIKTKVGAKPKTAPALVPKWPEETDPMNPDNMLPTPKKKDTDPVGELLGFVIAKPMKPKKTTVKKTKTKIVATKGINPIKKVTKKKVGTKSNQLSIIKKRLLRLSYLKDKEKEFFGDTYAKKINDWM